MITLIGMGSGTPESLTAQGLAALQNARTDPGGKAPAGTAAAGLHGTPEGPVSA